MKYYDIIYELRSLVIFHCSFVYHMSNAAQQGGVIGFFQNSAESPFVFLLLQKIFRTAELPTLRSKATEICHYAKEDWNALLKYTAVFYNNYGNYYNYGLKKFIPGVSHSKLACLIETVGGSEKQSSSSNHPTNTILSLWGLTGDLIYNLTERYRSNGLAPSGVTTYFSSNCDAADAAVVQEYLISKNFEAWNSRVFKTSNENGNATLFEIRIASGDTKNEGTLDSIELGKVERVKGHSFVFRRGDYSPFLRRSIDELKAAKECFTSSSHAEKVNVKEVSLLRLHLFSFFCRLLWITLSTVSERDR